MNIDLLSAHLACLTPILLHELAFCTPAILTLSLLGVPSIIPLSKNIAPPENILFFSLPALFPFKIHSSPDLSCVYRSFCQSLPAISFSTPRSNLVHQIRTYLRPGAFTAGSPNLRQRLVAVVRFV